jgi:hypothetical protein
MDLADNYFGFIGYVYLGTTKAGVTTYKEFDFFLVENENGKLSFTTKAKIVKGQKIRIVISDKVVKTITV